MQICLGWQMQVTLTRMLIATYLQDRVGEVRCASMKALEHTLTIIWSLTYKLQSMSSASAPNLSPP